MIYSVSRKFLHTYKYIKNAKDAGWLIKKIAQIGQVPSAVS